MQKILNRIKSFSNQLFTPVNLSKIIIIFTIGILSRHLINTYFDINVFKDYLTLASLTYYSVFACFMTFIHELFSHFNISIIPNFLIEIGVYLSNLIKELFLWIMSRIIDKKAYILNMFSSSRPKGGSSSKSHSRSSGSRSSHTSNSKNYSKPSSKDSHRSSSSINKSPAKSKNYQLDNRLPVIPQGHPLGDCHTRIPIEYQQYFQYMYNNSGSGNFNGNFHYDNPINQNSGRYSSSNYSTNSIPYATTSFDNVAYSQNINGYNESCYDQGEVAKYFHVQYIEDNGVIRKVHTPVSTLSPINSNSDTGIKYSLPNVAMFDNNNYSNYSSDVTMIDSNDDIYDSDISRRSNALVPDIDRKREARSRVFDAIVQPPTYREVSIPGSSKGEAPFSLGIKYLFKSSDSNIQSLYLK
jgi:hypothetical protein